MLKVDWFAVPEGEIYPQMYRAGTVLSGELLDRALALGLVAESQDPPPVEAPARSRARK
jgi:hypothetical protein